DDVEVRVDADRLRLTLDRATKAISRAALRLVSGDRSPWALDFHGLMLPASAPEDFAGLRPELRTLLLAHLRPRLRAVDLRLVELAHHLLNEPRREVRREHELHLCGAVEVAARAHRESSIGSVFPRT